MSEMDLARVETDRPAEDIATVSNERVTEVPTAELSQQPMKIAIMKLRAQRRSDPMALRACRRVRGFVL